MVALYDEQQKSTTPFARLLALIASTHDKLLTASYRLINQQEIKNISSLKSEAPGL